MERTVYLEKCQKCAILKKQAGGTINNIPLDLIVVYDGHRYYPYKYELSFDNKGNAIHTAILHSLFANSIQYAELERVKENVK